MKDAANGISGEYYIEREDGHIDTLSISDYNKILLEWNEPERLAIQHAKGKVLDVGCGAGRVSLFLQSLGHDVVAIDSAPGAIEACKKRGLKKSFVMSAENIDFPEDTFDTIMLYGNNFGILGDDESIIHMLQSLHTITKPDGIIIAGSSDAKITEDESHLRYHKWNLERNRPIGLVRLRVKYKDLIDDWIELRLASPEEMRFLAENAGWKLTRIYQRGGRYVAILTKS